MMKKTCRQERDLQTRTDRFGVEVRERVMWDIREGVVGADTFIPKHVVIITWKNMSFAGGIDIALYKVRSNISTIPQLFFCFTNCCTRISCTKSQIISHDWFAVFRFIDTTNTSIPGTVFSVYLSLLLTLRE